MPSKIFLRVPDLSCHAYHKACNLIGLFDGTVPVIFYDTSEARYVPYPQGIAASQLILDELVEILGMENVVPKS